MFEQERFIGRLQRHVLADPAIQACFLSGSFGRRRADDFSDIDVALVFPNSVARSEAWDDRQTLTQAVMPYVAVRSFDATHVRPFFHIALYSNGTKVDYRYETREDLAPSPGDGELRILKDSDGWAADLMASSARLALPQPNLTAAELRVLDNRFWVMYWDVLRQLARGDSDKPFPVLLELLQFTMPPLIRGLPPEEPARQDLQRLAYGPDARADAAEMQRLLDAYLAARTALIRRQNLNFEINSAFESEIRRLVARLAS